MTLVPASSSRSSGGGSLPSGWNLQAGPGSPVGLVTPAALGALYIVTTSGALYLATGLTSADWVGVGGATSDAMGVVSSVVAQLIAAAGQDSVMTDHAAAAGSGNGAYWNYDGAVDGEQNWRVVTGPAGAHNIDFNKDGVLSVDGSPVGGSQPSAALTHRIPFAFNTAGLATGAALFTPTIGDFLLDMWIEIATLWNGTTPLLDIGTFDPSTTGIYQSWAGAALPLNNGAADAGTAYLSSLSVSQVLGSIRDLVAITMPTAFNDGLYAVAGANVNLVASAPGLANRVLPSKFVSATPLKVCVSQTGATDGAATGATAGSAALCLVTATPSAT